MSVSNFRCPLCGEERISTATFESRARRHTPELEYRYEITCPDCYGTIASPWFDISVNTTDPQRPAKWIMERLQ